MELYEKLEKLRQSESYREYARKRQALETQRSTAWDVERKAMAEAARKIYAARHEEIRGVAKPELPDSKRMGLVVATLDLTLCRLSGHVGGVSFPKKDLVDGKATDIAKRIEKELADNPDLQLTSEQISAGDVAPRAAPEK